MNSVQIESEAAGRRAVVEETIADLEIALHAAGIKVHWSQGAEPGGRPACGQKGKCFTWPTAEDESGGIEITCERCRSIWGNS